MHRMARFVASAPSFWATIFSSPPARSASTLDAVPAQNSGDGALPASQPLDLSRHLGLRGTGHARSRKFRLV
jgi:hypothetical protein